MNTEKTNNVTFVKTEYTLLIIVIIVGAVLRFWNFHNIPFMHDELSALSRLEFDGIIEVIRNGVMLGDTHPAGVQVFLHYWTSVVGTSEIMVKLPFIISGIISIWVSYLIGKLWFDSTTGLFTAVFVASTQFFVLYSQIARPYVSGLLITLLMVYFWSLYFFKEKRNLYLILYVVFSALAAYNHHFSLLFAAIVGITGLTIIKKENLLAYLIAGVSIFVLYIPHLHIFFSQLSQGGIGGWLSKPKPTFIIEFLHWIFQYSYWSWIATTAVVLYLIVFLKGKLINFSNGYKKRWILITWFLLPIVIGYIYSVLRNPVIQYSMLIFSTPYLIVLLFSFHKKVKSGLIAILVFILMATNIVVLVVERDHYNIFYKQPYQELFKAALVDNRDSDVFVLDDCVPYYNEYYFDKYNKVVPYFTKRNSDIDLQGFIEVVDGIEQDIVITHALTNDEIQIVQTYFPFQIGYEVGFTYEIYTFAKEKQDKESIINKQLLAQTNFVDEIGEWKDVSGMTIYDSISNSNVCQLMGDEWGPSIGFDLIEIAPDGLGIIDIELKACLPDSLSSAFIAASIIEEGETIYFGATDFSNYILDTNEWKSIFLSIDIQGALKGRDSTNGLTVKIVVWNPKNNRVLIDDIAIYLKPGNPLRYSLYR